MEGARSDAVAEECWGGVEAETLRINLIFKELSSEGKETVLRRRHAIQSF